MAGDTGDSAKKKPNVMLYQRKRIMSREGSLTIPYGGSTPGRCGVLKEGGMPFAEMQEVSHSLLVLEEVQETERTDWEGQCSFPCHHHPLVQSEMGMAVLRSGWFQTDCGPQEGPCLH